LLVRQAQTPQGITGFSHSVCHLSDIESHSLDYKAQTPGPQE